MSQSWWSLESQDSWGWWWGGEGMRIRRCREKDRRGGIEHRIYLFYHLVWVQPTKLTPKSNDQIQLNPGYILRLRFWILGYKFNQMSICSPSLKFVILRRLYEWNYTVCHLLGIFFNSA